MSTAVATGSKTARVAGIVTAVFGVIFIIAGAITWGSVSSHLAAENITVADDAANFAGELVDTPWEAFAQADIINHHALDATGGLTYSELDREDPLRATAMNASFLRASLFTSVVAFGVAALVMGLGVLFIVIGWALRALGLPAGAVVAEETAAVPPKAPAATPTSSGPTA